MYGALFIERLHYNQYQVNSIAVAAELALYLPVPIFGYLIDRNSPRIASFIAAFLFAFGYTLAAFTYRAGPPDENGYPVWCMVLAFVGIGVGTCSMYLGAVTACVKNFGRGKYKGLALSLPTASFGLSGMWESQVGSRILYENQPDGTKGDVDVFRFFIFLAISLFVVGLLGTILQKVVDEDELIDEAVDELHRSGLLDDSPFFHRLAGRARNAEGYGTISQDVPGEPIRPTSAGQESWRSKKSGMKTRLLNVETRRFLLDPTMWLLAFGFFLVSGPIETFINNLGTIVMTLYPPGTTIPSSNSASTQVGIYTISSTLARFVLGALSDVLAPNVLDTQQRSALTPSIYDHEDPFESSPPAKSFSVSRVIFLLMSPVLLFFGYALLLVVAPSTPSIFTLITCLMGLVNGGSFCLVPIVISVVWGVGNFGTNWGIIAMMPALGATLWSGLYSFGYQQHADGDGLCFGRECWSGTVIGMVGAAVLAGISWGWAGFGWFGWRARGVIV